MESQHEKTKLRNDKKAFGNPYNVGDKVWLQVAVRKNKLEP